MQKLEAEKIGFDELTSSFMEKLSVGSSFALNSKNYFVKCVGKWKADNHFGDRYFKTVTVKCEQTGESIKFFYFFGFDGNPRSKSRNASVKQHKFVRDVEGTLVVDLINRNNPLHEMSEIYRMATQN